MPPGSNLVGTAVKFVAMLHLNAVVSPVAMWLVVRSRWLHDLFCGGSEPYNWLLGSIGLAAVVGMAIRILS